MDRKNVIRKTAILLADAAFKKWGKTGIPRYLAGFSIDRSAPSDEIRSSLADYLERNMLERYPEDTYTQRLEDEITAAKTDDLLELISLNRSIDPRTVEYAAFKPLYNPDEGPDWYGMSQAELRLQMKKLGYDPDKGGQAEMVRFMDALRNNAERYERTSGVEEGMKGVGPVLASLISPSFVEESVRQSVTGDYDEDRATRARVVDFLANSLMAGGLTGALVPGRIAFPSKAIPLASTPLRAAGIAGGTEEARQVANALEGRDASFASAPIGSAIAAGTVPAAAQYLASILSKGTDPAARVFTRGFSRGLRNYDPVKAEKDAFRQELLRARKINESMPPAGSQNQTTPGGAVYRDNAAMAATEGLASTIEKLRYLGFPLESELPLRRPGMAGRPITVEDIIGSSSASGRDKVSGLSGKAFKLVSPQGAGKNVVTYSLEESGNAKPYDMVDAALDMYDPETSRKMFLSFQKAGNGLAAPKTTFLRNADEYNRGKSLFPAKTDAEISMGVNESLYKKGIKAGNLLGEIFGRFEPMTRVNPMNPADVGSRVSELQQRPWYQDAVKTGKKKNREKDGKMTVGKYRTHKLIGGN